MTELKAVVKLPLFDGKESNFCNWWARFKAYARVHGFADVLTDEKPALLGDTESDPKHFDETSHSEVVKMYKKNAVAVSQFTMSFTNDECMGYVFKSITS